jgi:hypothetical protein
VLAKAARAFSLSNKQRREVVEQHMRAWSGGRRRVVRVVRVTSPLFIQLDRHLMRLVPLLSRHYVMGADTYRVCAGAW